MKRLRIFFVEILGVPIILGWLFLQYPEVFDAAVPWVALLVLLHLTWEFVVEPSKEVLEKVGGKLKKAPIVMVMLIAAGLYLLVIKTVMIDLAFNYKHITLPHFAGPIPPALAYEHTPRPPGKIAYPLVSVGMVTGEPVSSMQLRVDVRDWPTGDFELQHGSLLSLFHFKVIVSRIDLLVDTNQKNTQSVRNQSVVMQIDKDEWNGSDTWRNPTAMIPLDRDVTVFSVWAETRQANWLGYLIVRRVGNRLATEQAVRGGTFSASGQRRVVRITIFQEWDKDRPTLKSSNEYHDLTTERLKKLGVPEVKRPL